MAEKTNGLSRDLIVHPGETLSEILHDRSISNKDIAIRTSVSEKHISMVTRGLAPISNTLAKKLEYVLNIDSSFWLNLQANYDNEVLTFEEINKIGNEELSIAKILKDVIKHFIELNLMPDGLSKSAEVLELRRILSVSNLTVIPRLEISGAYRGSDKVKIDPYVLYAWQKLCEIQTEQINVGSKLNLQKMRSYVPRIKKMMYNDKDINRTKAELTALLAECGIAFNIVRHFKGAPVQGFIKKTKAGKIILCMTIRQSYADIFWFTLFHEISHILNDDVEKQMIDYTFVKDSKELNADKMASDFLIDPENYFDFINKRDFSLVAINAFSNEIAVPNYIVIGRLQKEKQIPPNWYAVEKIRYKWA